MSIFEPHQPINSGNNPENPVYGAEMKEIELDPKHYNRYETVTIRPPWYGQYAEKTFLNYTNRLNKPNVDTYKYMELNPVNYQLNDDHDDSNMIYDVRIPENDTVGLIERFKVSDVLPSVGNRMLFNLFIMFIVIYVLYIVFKQYQ
jgi:hypothetical protein